MIRQVFSSGFSLLHLNIYPKDSIIVQANNSVGREYFYLSVGHELKPRVQYPKQMGEKLFSPIVSAVFSFPSHSQTRRQNKVHHYTAYNKLTSIYHIIRRIKHKVYHVSEPAYHEHKLPLKRIKYEELFGYTSIYLLLAKRR